MIHTKQILNELKNKHKTYTTKTFKNKHLEVFLIEAVRKTVTSSSITHNSNSSNKNTA